MTAIEWLIDNIPQRYRNALLNEGILQQALEIEKQQIMNAYNVGNPYKTAEQYYNETYGSKGSDEITNCDFISKKSGLS